MTLFLGMYTYYVGAKVVLHVHNDFMRQWNAAKAEGRL